MSDTTPTVISKPAPNPVQIYSICDLAEHDMDNILLGLELLCHKLDKQSLQRKQAVELHYNIKSQREERRKKALKP